MDLRVTVPALGAKAIATLTLTLPTRSSVAFDIAGRLNRQDNSRGAGRRGQLHAPHSNSLHVNVPAPVVLTFNVAVPLTRFALRVPSVKVAIVAACGVKEAAYAASESPPADVELLPT